jgi:type IV secretory pathway TrbL component
VDKKGLVHTKNVEYTKKNWILHEDDLPFKTFLSILITMTISLFIGLSAHYDMFTFLYNLVSYPMKFILMYLAPITILGLVLVQFVFAYKNYQITKYYTDG